jgi:hypothetical protein
MRWNHAHLTLNRAVISHVSHPQRRRITNVNDASAASRIHSLLEVMQVVSFQVSAAPVFATPS